MLRKYWILLLSAISHFCVHGHHSPSTTLAQFGQEEFSFPEQKFLIYGVNRGEGFNLRRDVYMRVANAVRQLRERGHDYVLVLPPWGNIWHWRRRDVKIAWGELFDLESLAQFVPVMEFEEFQQRNNAPLDLALYLQHYAEGWSEQEGFVIKYGVRPCMDAHKFYKQKDSEWEVPLVGLRAKRLECLSIQGQSSTLADAIIELFPNGRSLMVDRAETILHDHFGDVHYWNARRSMRYSKKLRVIGEEFMKQKFNVTQLEGGNYLCAHLRRADFVWAHKENIPSLEGAAKQLIKLASTLQLNALFLCTDASEEEVASLKRMLNAQNIRVELFSSGEDLSEAALSILDQWICAHARHFIGTHHSTFSFRIHEDREILGFSPNSTFNRLCPDHQIETGCEQPAQWRIVTE